MGLFERYLTIWVAAAIATGVTLGMIMPGLLQPLPGWNTPVSTLWWQCSSG
jgi:ACR3 family arsenite efflux pump ArsB